MRRRVAFVVVFALASSALALVSAAGGVADAPGCVQMSALNRFGSRPLGETFGRAISPDGRYVAFDSRANDFAVTDLNGQEGDAFVRDMHTGTIELVSKTTQGTQVDAWSSAMGITPSGRFVLMMSHGDLAGSGNGLGLYVRDRQQGTTSLVVGQIPATFHTLGNLADISDDGRYIVFVTPLALAVSDTNGVADVYRLDRLTGQRLLVSVADDESVLVRGGWDATVSADGNRVVFHSETLNATGVRDISAGTTLSLFIADARITADGSAVVGMFRSWVQAFDASTGTMTMNFETKLIAPKVMDLSANGRYLLLSKDQVLFVFDRVSLHNWRVPSAFSVPGYLADDGVVSSSSADPAAYVYRGPITTWVNQNPIRVTAGTTVEGMVFAQNLFEGTTISFGPGTTTTVLNYPWEDAATVRVSVDPFAVDGMRDVTIVSPLSGCQTSAHWVFEVVPRLAPPTTHAPTTSAGPTTTANGTTTSTTTTTRRGVTNPQIYDFTPVALRPGEPQDLIILGNSFYPDARIEIDDVTVISTTYVSNRRLEARVTVDPSARGPRTVRVVNPDGQYAEGPFAMVLRGSEGEFQASTPRRSFDSRNDSTPIVGEQRVHIDGLPATGVRSVVANLTVTESSADSYLTLYRTGTNRPETSNINFRAGETKANMATFEVDQHSDVTVFNAAGTTHMILDVVGYYTEADANPGSAFVAVDPYRSFDSRIDRPLPLGPGEAITLPVLHHEPAAAVMLNVTVTNPTATGYLTIWPGGQLRPVASSVNFEPGQTVPNVVVVPVNAAGEVSLFNSFGTADVIVDVLGWFDQGNQATATGRYVAMTPTRLMDTRSGQGAPAEALGPHATIAIDNSRAAIPASATAIVLNVTADQPSEHSYLTVWTSAIPMPATSNLNLTPGHTTANLVVVRLGADRRTNVFNAYGTTHVIADIVGYYD